jgi:anti-sigma B factor antagonist
VDGARSSQPGSSLPPEAEPFRCDVWPERAAVTVRPVGELDVSTVPVLAARIAELRHAGFRQVVLDLSGLLFIDSSGLHMIIDCEAKARQDGFAFDLIPGSRPIQRVFEITGLAGRLPFRDSEDRGPNSLGGAA